MPDGPISCAAYRLWFPRFQGLCTCLSGDPNSPQTHCKPFLKCHLLSSADLSPLPAFTSMACLSMVFYLATSSSSSFYPPPPSLPPPPLLPPQLPLSLTQWRDAQALCIRGKRFVTKSYRSTPPKLQRYLKHRASVCFITELFCVGDFSPLLFEAESQVSPDWLEHTI